MITIIITLLVLNFLFAKLMIYTVLEVFKLVTENQGVFLQMFQKNIVEWAVFLNQEKHVIKESLYVHIPILNIFTSISCIIFIQFFKTNLK
jgi:hypothetical protein